MKKPRMLYRARLWGGFCDGILHQHEMDRGWGGWGQKFDHAPAIYTSRAKAHQHYEDVRPVEVRELRSPPKRKPRSS